MESLYMIQKEDKGYPSSFDCHADMESCHMIHKAIIGDH